MSREERLFDAIGGVDESLLKRSEKTRRQRVSWMEWAVGLAACLALVLTVTWVLPGALREPPPPDHITDDLPPDNPPIPAIEDPEDPGDPGCTQPDEPWPAEEGEWHYLAVRAAPEEPELRFRIYINKALYYSYLQGDEYIIYPYRQPDGTPECRLKISHMADVTVDEALEQVRAGLTGLFETVEALPGPPNGWFEVTDTERYLYASNGTAWDAAQREVWIKPDGAGGVFLLASNYFLEAAEGHGARFVDMMSTFVAESDLWEMVWMAQLMDAGERLAEAVFAQDLDRAADLLAEGAEVSGYVEDVSSWVSVSSIDCTFPPETRDGVMTASVSVEHRLSTEEAYNYLTMDMTYQDGQWKAVRIGLEN